jgi:hypothetical protein
MRGARQLPSKARRASDSPTKQLVARKVTIFKTRLDVVDGPWEQLGLMDTISWRGQLWLVPRWQRAKSAGNRQPVRVIRPKLFQFERVRRPQNGEDYSLACEVPKAILDGQQVSGNAVEFEVVEAPDFETQIPNLQ